MIHSTGKGSTAARRERACRAALVVLACVASACDELPTTPVGAEPAAPQMTIIASADAISAVEDALNRLVPALDDPTAADPLRISLGSLQKLLEDHNGDGAAEATKAALNMITAYERRTGYNGSEAAELDAIRLALQ